MNTALKLVLPLLAATVLAGCGQDAADTAAEKIAKQHGVDMDIDRDGDTATYTMSGPDGGKVQVGENLTVPSDFPGDVPVYPDLKIISSTVMPQGATLTGETGDSLDKVAGFYADKMVSEGWEKESEMTQPEMRMVTFKKEGRNAAVHAFKNEDKTTIQLTAAKTGG